MAQFFSNPLASFPQDFSALSFSVMLSMISFLSRHLKYASLASQHCDRWLRSGAIGAPSAAIFGGGRDAWDEPKSPMMDVWRVWRGGLILGRGCDRSAILGIRVAKRFAKPNTALRHWLTPGEPCSQIPILVGYNHSRWALTYLFRVL